MQLHEAKYKAANGKKYVRYTVRSMQGSGHGFGVLDILQNVFVNYGFKTRKDARQWLAEEQEKQAAKEQANAASA
jgi:hypothetical protein